MFKQFAVLFCALVAFGAKETRGVPLSSSLQDKAAAPLDVENTITPTNSKGSLSGALSMLDLQDLVEVASVSPRFEETAHQVFRDKYADEKIEIWVDVNQEANPDSLSPKHNNHLQLLKVFGPDMRKLEVHYSTNDKDSNAALHEEIMKDCSDTVVDITFHHLTKDLEINRPFTNLKMLHLSHGEVPNCSPKFQKCFPNLSTIQIENLSALETMRVSGMFAEE